MCTTKSFDLYTNIVSFSVSKTCRVRARAPSSRQKRSKKNATFVREFHKNAAGLSRECCGKVAGKLQEYHGNAAGMLREYHGNAAGIPRECRRHVVMLLTLLTVFSSSLEPRAFDRFISFIIFFILLFSKRVYNIAR